MTRYRLRGVDDTWQPWPNSWIIVDATTGHPVASFASFEWARVFCGALNGDPRVEA